MSGAYSSSVTTDVPAFSGKKILRSASLESVYVRARTVGQMEEGFFVSSQEMLALTSSCLGKKSLLFLLHEPLCAQDNAFNPER